MTRPAMGQVVSPAKLSHDRPQFIDRHGSGAREVSRQGSPAPFTVPPSSQLPFALFCTSTYRTDAAYSRRVA